jgi:hypothetical protein
MKGRLAGASASDGGVTSRGYLGGQGSTVGRIGWGTAQASPANQVPLDGSVYSNPNGYEWTGVSKMSVTVT